MLRLPSARKWASRPGVRQAHEGHSGRGRAEDARSAAARACDDPGRSSAFGAAESGKLELDGRRELGVSSPTRWSPEDEAVFEADWAQTQPRADKDASGQGTKTKRKKKRSGEATAAGGGYEPESNTLRGVKCVEVNLVAGDLRGMNARSVSKPRAVIRVWSLLPAQLASGSHHEVRDSVLQFTRS